MPGSSRTITTASFAIAAGRSRRSRVSTPPGASSMSAPSARCCCPACASATSWCRKAKRAALPAPPIPSLLDQMTVADFIAQGHFARHIKRMRRLYGERRAALVEALAGQLGDRLTIADATGGMQLLARLAPGEDDLALAARAHARGLAPTALSATAVEAKCGPGLLLGFTNIPAASATRAARRLREALED